MFNEVHKLSYTHSYRPMLVLFPACNAIISCAVLNKTPREVVFGGVKLALTEKDEEFSDELREDCEVRGEGRGGPQSVRWFQPLILANRVCCSGSAL